MDNTVASAASVGLVWDSTYVGVVVVGIDQTQHMTST